MARVTPQWRNHSRKDCDAINKTENFSLLTIRLVIRPNHTRGVKLGAFIKTQRSVRMGPKSIAFDGYIFLALQNQPVLRFIPLAVLVALSTIFVAYSQGDSSNRANDKDPMVNATKGSKGSDKSSPIATTEDNFPQAYTNLRFDAIIK